MQVNFYNSKKKSYFQYELNYSKQIGVFFVITIAYHTDYSENFLKTCIPGDSGSIPKHNLLTVYFAICMQVNFYNRKKIQFFNTSELNYWK